MDDPRRSFEFRLLDQADKVRLLLVGFFVLAVYTVPRDEVRNFAVAASVITFAALYALFTRFILMWRAVRSEGHVHLMAGLLVCADILCISVFVWALGPRFSSLAVLLLFDVIFAAGFFWGIEVVLVAVMVCGSYAILAATGEGVTSAWAAGANAAATIIIAWLAYALAEVGRRERASTARIVSNLTEGVMLVSAEGELLVVNPRIEHMTGIRASNVVGLGIGDPDSSEALKPLAGLLADADHNPNTSAKVTARDLHIEDPEPMDVQVLTVPCVSERAGLAGWVIVCKDLTAMVGDVRAREESLTVVSHELRERVHSVRAITEMLSRMADRLTPQMRAETIGVLGSETDRLSRVIARVLDAAAVERGELTFEAEEVFLDKIAHDVCAGLQTLADEKDITLTIEVEGGIPPVVGDTTRLDQVIQNFVENAIKFTSRGGTIGVLVGAEGDTVNVTVSDTGQGIPDDRREVIFDKFVRDENHATIARHAGLGLGLYICREIVRHHEGTIDVQSAVGEGSTFSFSIPLEHAHQD